MRTTPAPSSISHRPSAPRSTPSSAAWPAACESTRRCARRWSRGARRFRRESLPENALRSVGKGRNDVRSFGNEGHVRIGVARHALWDRRTEIVHSLHTGERGVEVAQAVGVEVNAANAHGLALHLGLPLVDVRVGLALDAGGKAGGAEIDEPSLRVNVMLRAHALGA